MIWRLVYKGTVDVSQEYDSTSLFKDHQTSQTLSMTPLVALVCVVMGAVAKWFVPVGRERWVGWHWSLALIHHGTWDLYCVLWSPRANVRSARPRYSMFTETHFLSRPCLEPSSFMFAPVHPLPSPHPLLPIPLINFLSTLSRSHFVSQ